MLRTTNLRETYEECARARKGLDVQNKILFKDFVERTILLSSSIEFQS